MSVTYFPNICTSGKSGCCNWFLWRETRLRGILRPSSTKLQSGWVAQVVEHLCSKHVALSSNHSCTKKKKTLQNYRESVGKIQAEEEIKLHCRLSQVSGSSGPSILHQIIPYESVVARPDPVTRGRLPWEQLQVNYRSWQLEAVCWRLLLLLDHKFFLS
jgi:hypothetical protein